MLRNSRLFFQCILFILVAGSAFFGSPADGITASTESFFSHERSLRDLSFFSAQSGCSAFNSRQSLYVQVKNGKIEFLDTISNENLCMTFAGMGRKEIHPTKFYATNICGNKLNRISKDVNEWLINRPKEGFEHGVTIRERPCGTSPVRVVWKLGGSLVPCQKSADGEINFTNKKSELKITGICAWDSTGRKLDAHIEFVQPDMLTYVLNDTGAVYPVVIDPFFTQEDKLVAESRADVDFGWTADINGDYAVIGAPDEEKVYVFKNTDGNWAQSQILTATNGTSGDNFGFSLDLNENSIIVGAPGNAANTGSAYIFSLSGGLWQETQQLSASDGEIGDQFGYSTAMDGDWAVIGSYADDSGAGSAYIFKKNSGSWQQDSRITALDAMAGDNFGCSVSIRDDNLAVGAFGADGSAGRVYTYHYGWSGWYYEDKFQSPDSSNFGFFGSSLSMGKDCLAVGAIGDNGGAAMSGAAYIYVRNSSGWNMQQKLTDSSSNAFDSMGSSVALSGNKLLVGADNAENDTGKLSGLVYLFIQQDNHWDLFEKYIPADAQDSDEFGIAAGFDGHRFIIGADQSDSNLGAAYVFNATTPSVLNVSPGNNSTDIAMNTILSAVFSQTMNSSAVSTSFLLNCTSDHSPVSGNITVSSDKLSATFTPEATLFPTTEYLATLTSDITNLIGINLPVETTWSFTTSSGLDLDNAGILYVFPESMAGDVSVNSCLVVKFNKEMDPSSITNNSFYLEGVNGTVRYDQNCRKAYFIPNSELDFSTTYKAVITTAVKDAFENPLSSEQLWVFTTEDESPDSDGDGVNNNQDSYPDNPTKATFNSAVCNHVYTLILNAEAGAAFKNIKSMSPFDPGLNLTDYPIDGDFSTGLTYFEIGNMTKGASAQVTLSCDSDFPDIRSVYKTGTKGFYPFTAHSELGSESCTLNLIDGGYGDEDLVLNGRIVDPVGISESAPPKTENNPGGCVMNPGSDSGLEWFLLFYILLIFILRRSTIFHRN